MTGVRIVVAWAIGIVALVWAGHATRAEEQFKLLDEKQIRAKLSGRTLRMALTGRCICVPMA